MAEDTNEKTVGTETAKQTDWPQTSGREFSKRMFVIFMWGFFVHILITILCETFFNALGSASRTLELSIPVYTTIFAAVIVKGGVENVFKGKTQNARKPGVSKEQAQQSAG